MAILREKCGDSEHKVDFVCYVDTAGNHYRSCVRKWLFLDAR
jgi:hypothetical protein